MTTLLGWLAADRGYALDLAARATALLLAAHLAHWVLGRRRALARSALWDAALVGLALLPAAGGMLPRLRIVVSGPTAAPRPVAPDPGPPPPLADVPIPGPTVGPPPPILATRPEPHPVGATPRRPALAPVGWTPDPAGAAWGLYLAGSAVLALRLVGSARAAARLRRRAASVDDPAWLEALDDWRGRLGVRRPVGLRSSPDLAVPAVVGAIRPAILIPAGWFGAADRPLIDASLAHELAHVRRADFGWNVFRRLVMLVYWPHPLAWPLGRMVGAAREQACDDLCVHALGGAPAYRAALLEVASQLARRPRPGLGLGLGLAMARSTRIGARLDWIDRTPGSPRCVPSRPARLATLAAVAALAALLGVIDPAQARPAPLQAPAPQDPPRAVGVPAPAEPEAIMIEVLAADTGKPLAGASVQASIDLQPVDRKADRDGRVRFDLSKRHLDGAFSFDAWADGYVQQRYQFSQRDARRPKIPMSITVRLLPGEETLGGRVTDEAGRPIGGVRVETWGYLGEKKDPHELAYHVDAVTDDRGEWRCRSFRRMKFAYLYLSHPDYLADDQFHPRPHGQPSPSDSPQPGGQKLEALRDFSDVQVLTRGVAIAGTVEDERGRPVAGAEVGWIEDEQGTFHSHLPTTRTDAAGAFRFEHARPGRLLLQAQAPGHAPALTPVEARAGVAPVALQLGTPRPLIGRVVDSAGRPIAGVVVNVDTWRTSRALGVYLKTDANGEFAWADAPDEEVQLNFSRTGFQSQRPGRFPPGEPAAVTLRRSLSISGWVRDAKTGKSIDEVHVDVAPAVPGGGPGVADWRPSAWVSAMQGLLQADIDAEAAGEFRLRFRAKGYATFESRPFRSDEGQVEYDVKLEPTDAPQGEVISGVVRRPDGRPLAGAEVTLAYPFDGRDRPSASPALDLRNGSIPPAPGRRIARTDEAGRFQIEREPDPGGRHYAVVVVHPEFFAEVDRAAFEVDRVIAARPWGRIEGTARVGGRPAPSVEVRYNSERYGYPDDHTPYVMGDGWTKADDGGRFAFDRVIPGDVRVAHASEATPGARPMTNGALVEVRAGETTRVDRGRPGRPVVARVAPPLGAAPQGNALTHSVFTIVSDRPMLPYPSSLKDRQSAEGRDRIRTWAASPEGRNYRRDWYQLVGGQPGPDGTLRADDVPPGDYRLDLTLSGDPARGSAVARATRQFTVPDGPADEPVDLGTIRPRAREPIRQGQEAPGFAAEALDGGGPIRLGDFQGRFVLVDFWSAGVARSVAGVAESQTIQERFGGDGRFALIHLGVDADREAARKLATGRKVGGRLGSVGAAEEGSVADAYRVEAVPALFLVGPDGKVRGQFADSRYAEAAVEAALKGP